jgi:hypothetical protein
MAERKEKHTSVMVNRAPVLTLWAAVVAEILGSVGILSWDVLVFERIAWKNAAICAKEKAKEVHLTLDHVRRFP